MFVFKGLTEENARLGRENLSRNNHQLIRLRLEKAKSTRILAIIQVEDLHDNS